MFQQWENFLTLQDSSFSDFSFEAAITVSNEAHKVLLGTFQSCLVPVQTYGIPLCFQWVGEVYNLHWILTKKPIEFLWVIDGLAPGPENYDFDQKIWVL